MSETCQCGCGHGAVVNATALTGSIVGPTATVEDTVRQFPRAADVFRRLGIDTCCGGRLTLSQAAASAGVAVDVVLEALARGRQGAA